jgi:hypothetical protein
MIQLQEKKTAVLSLLTALLAWMVNLLSPLVYNLWWPEELGSDPSFYTEAQVEALQRWAIASFFCSAVFPSLLAITACIMGIIAIRKRHSLSRCVFAIIGILIGGVFLFWAWWSFFVWKLQSG